MKHSKRAITAEGELLFVALNRPIDTKAAHAEQIGTCLALLREVERAEPDADDSAFGWREYPATRGHAMIT